MEHNQKEKDRIINSKVKILDALKQMDSIDKKLLLVFDGEDFLNILSIGDIQRSILKGIDLTTPIKEILRKKTRVAMVSNSFESIRTTMEQFRMELMPVIDENKKLVRVYFWEDIFRAKERKIKASLKIPVIIMAGGKGTRMKPLTNIIPKPLIPYGDSSIMEQIIKNFQKVGCNEFYASVNYKAEMIEFYFSQLENKSYSIDFFKENQPLGTAGSLHLLKGKIKSTFFVSNCDILIEDDYEEIYKYHKDNDNELTIVSAIKHYPIPYGTLETVENGLLKKITEKPEFTFQINTGFYIVEPHLLKEIPKDKFFHITHLMEKILKRKGKIGVYPVSDGSWKDIGVWKEYIKNEIDYEL